MSIARNTLLCALVLSAAICVSGFQAYISFYSSTTCSGGSRQSNSHQDNGACFPSIGPGNGGILSAMITCNANTANSMWSVNLYTQAGCAGGAVSSPTGDGNGCSPFTTGLVGGVILDCSPALSSYASMPLIGVLIACLAWVAVDIQGR